MSESELERAGVLAQVCSAELKLVDGARLMKVSYRQAIRLKQVFQKPGCCAPRLSRVIHGQPHGTPGQAGQVAVIGEAEFSESFRNWELAGKIVTTLRVNNIIVSAPAPASHRT